MYLIFWCQFRLESHGQFEMESSGQFKLELGGQYHWNFHKNPLELALEAFLNGTEKIETGIKKIGAMLGDNVEVGCGSVLNPGTVIGKNTNIYPLSSVRGVVPANSIYKNKNEIVEKI